MRRLIQTLTLAAAVLLVPACGKYLPNAPEDPPDAAPAREFWGLTVDITSVPPALTGEGEVTITATTAGGNGFYRYSWWIEDCYEDATGRERCNRDQARSVESGATVSFTRYRRAQDTRLRVTMGVWEVGGTKYGESVHSILGPNDRAAD